MTVSLSRMKCLEPRSLPKILGYPETANLTQGWRADRHHLHKDPILRLFNLTASRIFARDCMARMLCLDFKTRRNPVNLRSFIHFTPNPP